MRMKSRSVILVLFLVLLTFLAGCSSSNNGTPGTQTGSRLYVTTQGDSMLSAFNVDLSTGKLETSGVTAATGSTPAGLLLTSAGDTAFVLNPDSADVTAYTIGSDGKLSAAGGSQVVGTNPTGFAMDSAGHFLLIANPGSFNDPASGTVSVFSISGTTLSAVGSPISTADPGSTTSAGPVSVAVTPSGAFVYVANQFANTVSAFAMDANGVLTPVVGSPFPAGTAPSAVAVNPAGTFLFVANSGSSNVSAFKICAAVTTTCAAADGSLQAATNSPFSAGLGPAAMAVSPSGNFLYVADRQSNQLSGFKIGATTGELTAIANSASSTGVSPAAVVVSPGEQYVYAANLGSASVSVYTMDATSGVLTVVGNPVSTANQPSAMAIH